MDWKTRLYLRWDAYCQKAGLGSPSFQHGIDLRDGSFASNYVAKWGLEDEMTKVTSRRAKQGNAFRPAARCSGRQGRQAGGCAVRWSSPKAFKGKRQLSWSNGLKAKFNLAERTTRN